jgi:hypothetical protein
LRVEKDEIEEDGENTRNIDGFLKMPMGKAIKILNNRYRNAKAIKTKIEAARSQSQQDIQSITDEIGNWISLVKENVSQIYSDTRYLQRLEWYLIPSFKNFHVYIVPEPLQLFEATYKFLIERLAYLEIFGGSRKIMNIELNIDNACIDLYHFANVAGIDLAENYEKILYTLCTDDLEIMKRDLSNPSRKIAVFHSGRNIPERHEYLAATDELLALKNDISGGLQNDLGIKINEIISEWNKMPPDYNNDYGVSADEFLRYFEHVALMIESIPGSVNKILIIQDHQSGNTVLNKQNVAKGNRPKLPVTRDNIGKIQVILTMPEKRIRVLLDTNVFVFTYKEALIEKRGGKPQADINRLFQEASKVAGGLKVNSYFATKHRQNRDNLNNWLKLWWGIDFDVFKPAKGKQSIIPFSLKILQ